jgi:hypothetical protein
MSKTNKNLINYQELNISDEKNFHQKMINCL